MVLIDIDIDNCARCHQPFTNGDKVETRCDYACSQCNGGTDFLHVKCPDDALFDVARAECMKCGKAHRLAGQKGGYLPRQIHLMPCCMGPNNVQVRVTGRYREDEGA